MFALDYIQLQGSAYNIGMTSHRSAMIKEVCIVKNPHKDLSSQEEFV